MNQMSVLPNILKLLKNQIEILEIKNSIKKIKNDLAGRGTRADQMEEINSDIKIEI